MNLYNFNYGHFKNFFYFNHPGYLLIDSKLGLFKMKSSLINDYNKCKTGLVFG